MEPPHEGGYGSASAGAIGGITGLESGVCGQARDSRHVVEGLARRVSQIPSAGRAFLLRTSFRRSAEMVHCLAPYFAAASGSLARYHHFHRRTVGVPPGIVRIHGQDRGGSRPTCDSWACHNRCRAKLPLARRRVPWTGVEAPNRSQVDQVDGDGSNASVGSRRSRIERCLPIGHCVAHLPSRSPSRSSATRCSRYLRAALSVVSEMACSYACTASFVRPASASNCARVAHAGWKR